MKNKMKILPILATSVLVMLSSCNKTVPEDYGTGQAYYFNMSSESLYGSLYDFDIEEGDRVDAGDVVTFKVKAEEDFIVGDVLIQEYYHGKTHKCTLVSEEEGYSVYSAKLYKGRNNITGKFLVDTEVDLVEQFKLDLQPAVFDEIMNPTQCDDMKARLDFRRCGVEQVCAPFYWDGNTKKANTSRHEGNYFMNYVDGDTTHVSAKNLGYTIKIRYLGIDTPESTNIIEKWGLSASYFNKYIYTTDADAAKHLETLGVPEISGPTSIILVSQEFAHYSSQITYDDLKINSTEESPYHATADGNQRSLAYVWYSTVKNPTMDDFRCLNLEMVYNGYSSSSGTLESLSEHYYLAFKKANMRAEQLKLHVFSDDSTVDPNYYDWEKNGVKTLSMTKIYETTTKDSKGCLNLDSPYADKRTLYRIHGYISRKVGTSFYFQDQPSYSSDYLKYNRPYGLYVFSYTETDLRVGDEVEVVGALSSYSGNYQMQGVVYKNIDPDPVRDIKIVSRDNEIVPIKLSGSMFNSQKYNQVLCEITDNVYFADFKETSSQSGIQSIAEGGKEEVDKYNTAYPFYCTSNKPIIYGCFGSTDKAAEINSKYASKSGQAGARYADDIIRFNVDQEILITDGVETALSYRYFTGGTYLYNEFGAEYANMNDDNPYKEYTFSRTYKRVYAHVVVMSCGYESTSGNRKHNGVICSNNDFTELGRLENI